MNFLMKAFPLLLILGNPFFSFAQKPLDTWGREDVLQYFEHNNINFEGEFRYSSNNQCVLIGFSSLPEEKINFNFYMKDGVLYKALITTIRNSDFDLVNHEVENLGYAKTAEINDQLGNTYWKYTINNVELVVINKMVDWPEIYYRP